MSQVMNRPTTQTSTPPPAALTPVPAGGANADATPPAPAIGNSLNEIWLRWVKELVSALIGVGLVVGLLLLIRRALDFLGGEETDAPFQKVKDLLLFINPLVGVVIGYYFNRVSTEARAENAERTAHGATTTAQLAQTARGEAEAQAQVNKAEADEAKSVLQDIIPAAETVLSQMPPPAPAVLGSAGTASVDVLAETRVNLQRSLERARALTERRNP